MRTFFGLVLLFLSTSVVSQNSSDLRGSRVIANNGIFVKDTWVDSIQRSIQFKNQLRAIPSSDAVYRFVNSSTGFQSVQSIINRDTIPLEFRKPGLIVFVTDSSKHYKLGTDLSSWTEFSSGTGEPGEPGLPGVTTVANIPARDAIPTGNRYQGMIVFVSSENKHYTLKGGITNAHWQEFVSGGSGGGASGKVPDLIF